MGMKKIKCMDGIVRSLKVGDVVGFKADVEQSGVVLRWTATTIVVEGEDGEYHGPEEYHLEAGRFWVND